MLIRLIYVVAILLWCHTIIERTAYFALFWLQSVSGLVESVAPGYQSTASVYLCGFVLYIVRVILIIMILPCGQLIEAYGIAVWGIMHSCITTSTYRPPGFAFLLCVLKVTHSCIICTPYCLVWGILTITYDSLYIAQFFLGGCYSNGIDLGLMSAISVLIDLDS